MGISAAIAKESSSLTLDNLQVTVDTIWVLITGSLVFFMNCGFAMLETGFCRKKSSVNVLAKNTIVFSIATLIFWFIGFAFMFGNGGDYLGVEGFLLLGKDSFNALDLDWSKATLYAKFFFQLTFAGTAATIVSGAVTERIKFGVFVAFSALFVIIYSIAGHWVWGGGFLYNFGVRDFAGSMVVHFVGGCAALTGTWLLKPRLGKYVDWKETEKRSIKQTSFNGKKIVTMYPDNLSLATLGCFILWLGWFGFNAGSTLSANAEAISHILLATLIAGAFGAFGALSATTCSWIFYEKPSLSFIINGILAGCVSITASCAFVSIYSAAIIGIIGGIIVLVATILLEKSEIDDPVGAVPVHFACGIWGTLAVGIFSLDPQTYSWSYLFTQNQNIRGGLLFGGEIDLLFAQIIGLMMVGAFTLTFSYLAWVFIAWISYRLSYPSNFGFRPVLGLRVTEDEEIKGVDSLFVEAENE
ncbi:ammonium transporter [Aphanothece sacrum FPU1]|uniref:Ammonium transporter n=2 Tax=Aphanothece sacrum TaxID=1122 RepID=A0A401IDJ5_APHSA|nr:ammonium transporter [Aphanothece sacrum FPU1]GBF86824.1 ammonium transporter [Aphanothece sacrum FPU3]